MSKSNPNAHNREPEVVGMSPVRPVNASLLALILALPSLVLSQVRLLPAPREAHFAGETPLPERLFADVIGHDSEDEFAARDLEEAAHQLALPVHTGLPGYRVALMRSSSPVAKAQLAKHSLAFDPAMKD